MVVDSVIERLQTLENELQSLQIKFNEENQWRKVLEEWIFNRFGFDIHVELNKKQNCAKNIPIKEVGNDAVVDIEVDPPDLVSNDEILQDIPEESKPEERPKMSTVLVVDTSTTTTEKQKKLEANLSNKSVIRTVSTVRTGNNINFAVVVVKSPTKEQTIGKENEISIVETSRDNNTIINSPPDGQLRIPPNEDLMDVPQIPEVTEYHVTLKAKNAIKKLEDRENAYECVECKKVFDNVYKAEGHARHHFETKFKCIDCPLYFEVEQDLILHAQVVHYKLKKRHNVFTCYIGGCPWTSKSPEALRHHRTLKHSGDSTGGGNKLPDNTPPDGAKTLPVVSDSTESESKTGETDSNKKVEDMPPPSASAPPTKPIEETKVEEKVGLRKAEADDLISYKGRANGENSQWQCKVCEKSFSELLLAKTHVGKFHSSLHFPSNERKVRHVVCRICKKAFSNDNWLKRHELAEHRSSIKKYAFI